MESLLLFRTSALRALAVILLLIAAIACGAALVGDGTRLVATRVADPNAGDPVVFPAFTDSIGPDPTIVYREGYMLIVPDLDRFRANLFLMAVPSTFDPAQWPEVRDGSFPVWIYRERRNEIGLMIVLHVPARPYGMLSWAVPRETEGQPGFLPGDKLVVEYTRGLLKFRSQLPGINPAVYDVPYWSEIDNISNAPSTKPTIRIRFSAKKEGES